MKDLVQRVVGGSLYKTSQLSLETVHTRAATTSLLGGQLELCSTMLKLPSKPGRVV